MCKLSKKQWNVQDVLNAIQEDAMYLEIIKNSKIVG